MLRRITLKTYIYIPDPPANKTKIGIETISSTHQLQPTTLILKYACIGTEANYSKQPQNPHTLKPFSSKTT